MSPTNTPANRATTPPQPAKNSPTLSRVADASNNSDWPANCHGICSIYSTVKTHLKTSWDSIKNAPKEIQNQFSDYRDAEYDQGTQQIEQGQAEAKQGGLHAISGYMGIGAGHVQQFMSPTYALGDMAADAANQTDPGAIPEGSIRFSKVTEEAQAARTVPKGDPVSVATGEYLETWLDFFVPVDLPLDGTRYMALLLPRPKGHGGPLGPCQISAFDEVLCSPEQGKLDFFQADGHRIRFDRPFNFLSSKNAGYPHLALCAPWLRRLELRDRTLVKHFRQYDDGIYRLERIEDLNGNAINFHRIGDGLLERADGPNGLTLVFSNDANGRRTCVVLVGVDGSRLELARYAYDSQGRMTAAECAFGMSVQYYWHPERDLLLKWHNTTRRSESHFTYDDDGRVLHTRTNGIWNNDRFRYDSVNRETVYLPSGEERLTQRFRYDHNSNVTHEIDALGHTLRRVFDAAGFETAVIDANGNTTTKTYDIRGNLARVVDAEGRATTYAWSAQGALETVIDGAGKIHRFENDLHGNKLAETCAEGHTTRYIRDEWGRLTRTIFPDGAEESRAYDGHGRLIAVTDARGGATCFAHDSFGRVIAQTDALGGVTRFEYAAGSAGFAAPTVIIRPDGVRIQRAFTKDGVLASVTDGEGRTWRYIYGAFDVLQAIEDPGGGKLSFVHDCEGRIAGVTNQKGHIYHLIRDAAGRVTAEEDFDGRRIEYTCDPGGRVIETKKPDGVRLAYTYDRTGKLTSIKGFAADDSGGKRPLEETHYWYDRRGLLIRASNQAGLVEFERDGNGRIICESVNGRKVESKLNARGSRVERCIGRDDIGEALVRVAHDPLGMVASITIDDHAPLVFTRDGLGREMRRTSSKNFRLDHSWDAVGQMISQSAGSGVSRFAEGVPVLEPPLTGTTAERRYIWDKSNAPIGIDDLIWGKTRYAHNANGQVAEANFGDGFTEKFDYDVARNVVSVRLQGPDIGSSLGGLLAWQSTPGGVVQLARGPNGEAVALTHDLCGRVIERRVDRKGFRPKSWRYGWDALDRLVTCETPDGDIWFYRYDPFGRRLTKVRKLRVAELEWTAGRLPALVSAASREATKIWTWPEPPAGSGRGNATNPPIVGTHFIWDGDVVAEEAPLRLDGSIDWGRTTRWHFEPGGFCPLARQAPDGSVLYIVNDHLGTPREMFDEGGKLKWAASYATGGTVRGLQIPSEPANDETRAIFPREPTHPQDPAQRNFALKLGQEPAIFDCPIRFQGQWHDKESGLYYNKFRHYDPISNQYISRDPIGLFGGSKLHSYVNNPTFQVDPFGLFAKGARYLGGQRLSGGAMSDLRSNLAADGVDLKLTPGGAPIGNNPDAVGAFDPEKATVYLRKDTTIYIAKHESLHAKQFKELGKDKYLQQTTTEREQYVYDQLKASGFDGMNNAEIGHAQSYITSVGGVK